jgi:hypothetical protein
MKAADGAVFQPLQDVQTGLGASALSTRESASKPRASAPSVAARALRIGVHDQQRRQPGAAAPVVPSWMVMVVL